ncbi:MAG: methionine--tRNA ligase [Coxiella sp. RIFCSPHIGHO2_12_FULL_42_15]|nr:MAG: methionine--tRNA ligase [Coxiella sp. RIFCSPHIGHO2_12_FULL_42_15]
MRTILITTALNYANGPLHLGHMVEVIQADIWARFQRMRGHDCLYISGCDAHGTPIMISAKKLNITPEALIAKSRTEHQHDLAGFIIEVANYHTTHSDENRELSNLVYQRLKKNGDITRRTIEQAFDPIENIFLPDRFIRGTCPKCKAPDQYGDNCEACGTTYSPLELIDPVSAISGAKPIVKESEHFFFNLANYHDMLKDWIEKGHLQPEVKNKLKEWFGEELKSWDISRDAPYFGFEIPDCPGKYFYVWLDAPIGYMASFKDIAARQKNLDFDAYWQPHSHAELYHFIGKDIAYFHALFWPAMLKGAHFRLPTNVFVHGYLTINGQKMSKSRGTFITANKYLQHLDPEFLRYYIAAKLTPQVEDIDLNLEDFALRANADLVGKFINLASRSAGFITKKFNGRLSTELDYPPLFEHFVSEREAIAAYFESLNYNKAIRHIMALADQANQYIDHEKPWALVKQEGQENKVHAVCTQSLNLFKVLTTYLKPILPKTASAVEDFLNCEPLSWGNLATPLLDHEIKPFKPLLQRIMPEQLEQLAAG